MSTAVGKIVLLLTARAGATAAFRERFTALAREGSGPGRRWSLQLIGDEAVHVPHQDVMRDSPGPCDAVVEFIGPAAVAGAEPACVRIVTGLGTLVDADRSNAVVCDEYRITEGDGPVFVVMVLRRYLSMDRAAFMASWFGRHAALGQKVDGVRYRQNHADEAASAALGLRLGLRGASLDGFALSYFVDPPEAVAILSAPAVAVGAIADERTFIDHARSQFGLYRTIEGTVG